MRGVDAVKRCMCRSMRMKVMIVRIEMATFRSHLEVKVLFGI